MKVSKLTVVDVGNCFQLHASLVFITVITFTSKVQRHLFHFLVTLPIPDTHTMVFFISKDHILVITSSAPFQA
ncbi:hypothetical protein Gotri_006423 [Gossypium trilobum]|uniref:Uncharacterized protein n=1 Tax=Gossypium trilobum TaxID=34281 RepID=A0A7J9EZU2_9ROSI|nr:hypothetical protein [Gossypium trilobum]